jgi:ribosomal small subunit protein bTHX
MGKGDRKTKKGKLFMKSYGKSRPRHIEKSKKKAEAQKA